METESFARELKPPKHARRPSNPLASPSIRLVTMESASPDSLLQPAPSPAPTPVPSLPTEIIQRIIQLALPRVSYSTFPERYKTLKAFTLVNSTWRSLAQEELGRHLSLKHEQRLREAQRAAVTQRRPELWRTVQSVRLTDEEDQDNDVEAVFDGWKGYSQLSELWLISGCGVGVDLGKLSNSIPSAFLSILATSPPC
jgi:hypothetical protein